MDKPSRPTVLGGMTVKTVTGCGNMYVQLNWYEGRLFEVFATLGKGGGCAVCQSEALTRSVTLGLKHGVPVSEYTRQIRGIRCPSPVPFPKESSVLSCPDALAKVLEQYGVLGLDEVALLLRGANGDPTGEQGDEELSEEDAKARIAELADKREKQGVYNG